MRLVSLAEQLAVQRLEDVDRLLREVTTPDGLVALVALPDELPADHRILDLAEACRAGAGGQPLFSRELLANSDARTTRTCDPGRMRPSSFGSWQSTGHASSDLSTPTTC